jgi:hypothetical protein
MSNTYHERHPPQTGETAETRLAIFPKIKKTNQIIESIEDKEKAKSTIFREKEEIKVTKLHNR